MYKPLFTHLRLYHRLAAITMSDCVRKTLYLFQQAGFFKVFYNALAADKTVESFIRTGLFVHGSVRIQYIDQRQILPFSHIKVHRVVCRCDLHCTSAK